MPTSWEDYINSASNRAALQGYRVQSGQAFRPLRRVLANVARMREPTSVACLGAGVLNDIPFDELVLSGAAIHLVDWIPGVVDTGISQSVMIDRGIDADEEGDDGDNACVFCALGASRAARWCGRFDGARSDAPGICGSFAPFADDVPGCRS